MYGVRAGESDFEPRGNLIIVLGVVNIGGVLHQIATAASQQSAPIDHAGQLADRERPPVGSEQVHSIIFAVRLHEEAVGVLNVLLQPVPRGRIVFNSQQSRLLIVLPAACSGAELEGRDLIFAFTSTGYRFSRHWHFSGRTRYRFYRSRLRCFSRELSYSI